MGLGPRDQFSLCIRYCPAPFPQLNLYIWPLFSLYLQSWGLESNNPSSNPHFSISIWITFGSLPQFLHLYNLVILVQWLVGNTKTSILSQWLTDWRTPCGLSPTLADLSLPSLPPPLHVGFSWDHFLRNHLHESSSQDLFPGTPLSLATEIQPQLIKLMESSRNCICIKGIAYLYHAGMEISFSVQSTAGIQKPFLVIL